MATQFAFSQVPPSVAALPFMFARPQVDDRGWSFDAALASAIAAERAFDSGRRNSRARVAWLLCELAFQYGRRSGGIGEEMPLSRGKLAEALGISLCRVKRILALLSLSRVIATDGKTIRVSDWHRLCSVAGYDGSRLSLDPEEALIERRPEEQEMPNRITAAGDPACFV